MGMEEEKEICLAVGQGREDTERSIRGKSWGSWQQNGGTERRGKREGEPGI